jgi:hypothetical protein
VAEPAKVCGAFAPGGQAARLDREIEGAHRLAARLQKRLSEHPATDAPGVDVREHQKLA